MSSCSLTLFSVMSSSWTPFFVKSLLKDSLLCHVHLDSFFVKLFFDSLLCHVHLDPLLCSSCSLTLFSVMSSIWTLFFVKLFFDSLLRHVVQLDPLLCQVLLALSSPSCCPFGPPCLSSCSLTLFSVTSIWTLFKLLFDSLLRHVVHLDPLLCQVVLALSSLSCRPVGLPSLSSCSLTLFSVMSIWTPFFVKSLLKDCLLCHVHLDPLLCQVVL